MNNYQLHAIASSHYHTRYTFREVVAADTLPIYISSYPCFYICNKDKFGEKGSHWIALLFTHPAAASEMFDSRCFGLGHYSEEIKQCLQNNGNGQIKTNHIPYQPSHTDSCGMYCLWFADMRNRNISFDATLALLSPSNLEANDSIVCRFVHKHMSMR